MTIELDNPVHNPLKEILVSQLCSDAGINPSGLMVRPSPLLVGWRGEICVDARNRKVLKPHSGAGIEMISRPNQYKKALVLALYKINNHQYNYNSLVALPNSQILGFVINSFHQINN